MNPVTKRQEDLLFAAVSEHIRTGEAVSSDDLRTRYRLSYSPATIRNELLALSELGFLDQPHTSAGRIPTDRGYRWYADKISAASPLKKDEVTAIRQISEEYTDLNEFFRLSTEMLARMVQALVVGGVSENSMEPFYKSGFGQILSEPEFTESISRNSFGELVDSIDADVRSLIEARDFKIPHIFIGGENPIEEARPYSMIIKTIEHGDDRGVLAIIGAKRMRYDKGLSLLSALDSIFDE
ncbi:MAG: hypothetical protein HY220_01060 [Candidatus Sungbacteria bacterium]|uniref:Heat-inducible transcription repressor HrcA C-terminal domain-containing protein n=1 Tax=Candidatus Sungiibacteriota bacterium TaxID=2750080 RepID=A0A9D6QVD7_9BACT|nr:hypothetical protein [Candidatus Sungbacteria bacterium]